MVTIQEIISQRRGEVSAFEKQLQSQSELISEREAQLSAQERELIKETTPQAITVERQVSLAQRFGLGGVGEAVKGIRREKKAIREKALPQFKKAQEEIASARKQVISERARVAPIKAELTKAEQFERGRKLAQSGGLLFGEPKEVERGFRFQKQASRISRQQIALRKIGEPLFIDGKLFGFEADRQTIPLESLSIERLESLQSAGILELGKVEAPQQLFTPAPDIQTDRTFFGKAKDVFIEGLIPFTKIERKIFKEKVVPPVSEFLFTKPDISDLQEKSVGAGAVELVKFAIFQPIAGIGQELRLEGSRIKGGGSGVDLVAGTIVGGVGTLVPETPGGQIGTIGAFKLLSIAAPVVRAGASVVFGVLGTRTALDPSFTPEERVGGGIVGALGFAGTAFELAPFVKGGLTRFSPDFKPVKTGEADIAGTKFDTKFIGDLAFDSGKGQIGFIPEGIGKSPRGFPAGAGALERGGFGFKPSEQLKGFGGKELRLTTSQRGLVEEAGQFKVDPAVSEFGFFFTPADPITGIPQTRVSRLGLTDFLESPKGDISFSLTGKGQPQIIVTEPTPLVTFGKTGLGGKARVSPKGTSELEVTALANIKVLENLGATVIKGQRVDIIRGSLTDVGVTRPSGRGRVGDIIPSITKTEIPITSVLGGTFGITTNLTELTSKKTGGILKGQGGSFPPTNLISPKITLGFDFSKKGIPTFDIPTTGLTTPIIPPGVPTIFTELPELIIESPKEKGRRRKKRKTSLRGVDSFNTFVKSKGKFVRVNKKPKRLENALSLGADLVDNSTSRQFKVKKAKIKIKKPKKIDPYFKSNRFKFREFKQKGMERVRTPLNFIERTNFAIDTRNEVAGIPLKGVLEQRRRKVQGKKLGIKPVRKKKQPKKK